MASASGKPDGYPLPWCDKLDTAYWKLNMELCLTWPGWSQWQGKKDMATIIPIIDWLIRDGY